MTLKEHSRYHMTGNKPSEETRRKLSASRAGVPRKDLRKLTDEQVRYIRENYIPRDAEFGARALSRKFNVNHKLIVQVAIGKAYTDVE